ncbi:MAG: hypothetical protein RL497_371 [Pseudomonadota bacterium]
MFTKEDVVLFSRVQGQVLFKGVPVAKAKIIRSYEYGASKPTEDFSMTNDEGMFDLPVVIKKGASITPLVQFVVYQEIFVEWNGERQQIWSHGKMHKNENSEYDGNFKKITCELTAELERIDLNNLDYVFTNCKWDH